MTNHHDAVCLLLEEIGFPALRIKLGTAEVVEFNEQFSSLMNPATPPLHRHWFVEGVLPHVAEPDKELLKTSFSDKTPVRVQVALDSPAGEKMEYEMRTVVSSVSQISDDSILCVFIPLTGPIVERLCDAHLFEGQALERARIRDELHRGVSQQLLGAAFGCKVLAAKIAKLNEGLGKEASDLAELINQAVTELQNLVQSGEDRN